MPHYTVYKYFRVTEEVTVFAEDEDSAQKIAKDRDGDQTDYMLVDMDVVKIED